MDELTFGVITYPPAQRESAAFRNFTAGMPGTLISIAFASICSECCAALVVPLSRRASFVSFVR